MIQKKIDCFVTSDLMTQAQEHRAGKGRISTETTLQGTSDSQDRVVGTFATLHCRIGPHHRNIAPVTLAHLHTVEEPQGWSGIQTDRMRGTKRQKTSRATRKDGPNHH